MNNPKLTNILLIALIAFNILFFAVAHCSMHHRHSHRYDFRGREHGSFGNFHRGFGAHRGDYGGFHGGFRNHNCNCSDNR
jgi:hypothetical protein